MARFVVTVPSSPRYDIVKQMEGREENAHYLHPFAGIHSEIVAEKVLRS